MTDGLPAAKHTHGATRVPRCLDCGQPIGDQPVDTCPLCGFKLGDPRATGDDVTPYAASFQKDEARLFSMCKWVWTAGPERLKHLAMMRSSPASRRFATIHVVLFALALGILRATMLGWRFVTHGQADTGTVTKPTGSGWFKLAPLAPVPGDETASAVSGLWWNPAQALLGGAIALLAALLLIALARMLINVGLEAAHARPYRREQRMTAALCYATAWLTPMIVSSVILWVNPLLLFPGNPTTPTGDLLFLLPAGIPTGLALIFGWFWLLRLAATAPVDTRGRVTIMLALGTPAITITSAATWWFGLNKLFSPLFDALQMSF